MMPHSVNNNALMQLELPGMRTEWAELWYICGSCKGGNRIKSSMRENWFLVMFHFQTVCCCIGGTSRGSGGIWRCFAAAGQSMCGGSNLVVLDIKCRRTKMCDYGLLLVAASDNWFSLVPFSLQCQWPLPQIYSVLYPVKGIRASCALVGGRPGTLVTLFQWTRGKGQILHPAGVKFVWRRSKPDWYKI